MAEVLKPHIKEKTDVRIVKGVEDVAPASAVAHDPAGTQQAKVVRAGGLAQARAAAKSQTHNSPLSRRATMRRTRPGSDRTRKVSASSWETASLGRRSRIEATLSGSMHSTSQRSRGTTCSDDVFISVKILGH
jgi:hypothetical protein